MFMGGKFDSGKSVSLKGRSRDSNKAALLEESRRKREARQRQRAELASAKLLQRAFRRHAAVLALAARVRQGWEAEYTSVTKRGIENVKREEISSLVRGVTAFALRAAWKEDVRLVESLCELIVLQNEQGAPSERFLGSMGVKETDLSVWRRQMDSVTALCLWALQRSAKESPRQLLLGICQLTMSQDPWRCPFKMACELLLVTLETSDTQLLASTTGVMRDSVSRMDAAQLEDQGYPFILRVFTTHDLSSNPDQFPLWIPLLCGVPGSHIRDAAARAAPSQTLPYNLLAMAVADPVARDAFARVANYNFLQLLLPAEENLDDADIYDDDAVMVEADSRARALLSQLVECQDMRELAVTCLERSKATPGIDAALEAMAPLANLCSVASLTQESQRQLYILNELAFSTRLVPELWEGIHKNIKTVEGRFEAAAIDADFDSCLGLLFKASCSLLLALDDEEFFSTELFLSLEQWTELAKFTKLVVEVGLLQEFGFRQTPPGYSPGKTRTLAIRLLRMLSDREYVPRIVAIGCLLTYHSCRRPFLDEWHSETVWNAVKTKPELREEVATKVPFFIPLSSRVDLLHNYLSEARQSDGWQSGTRISIRRSHLFEDAFEHLGSMPLIDFRGRIRVDFVDSAGAEMGIDGGGLFRELMTEVMEKGFHPDTGLFSQCSAGTLYPNPSSLRIGDDDHVKHTLANYHFLGRMLGKSLMDSILINLPLATFFISKLLRKQHLHVNNLSSLDEDVSKNLMALKNYSGDVEADFGLTFSIMEDDSMGTGRCVELVPNGRELAVTNQNRMRYIFLVAKYRLHTEIMRQSNAFLAGFFSVVEPKWVSVFNENELQELISGPSKVDIADLRANTVYSGTFDAEHPTIVAFWKVVSDFTVEQQRQLLKFVTSTVRSPLRGFRDLQPKFCVRTADDDTTRLPTSSTCANLLRLPAYEDEEDLRTKLLQAISEGQGFYLS